MVSSQHYLRPVYLWYIVSNINNHNLEPIHQDVVVDTITVVTQLLLPIPTRNPVGILCLLKALLLGKHFLAPVSANEAGPFRGLDVGSVPVTAVVPGVIQGNICYIFWNMHVDCHSDT